MIAFFPPLPHPMSGFDFFPIAFVFPFNSTQNLMEIFIKLDTNEICIARNHILIMYEFKLHIITSIGSGTFWGAKERLKK